MYTPPFTVTRATLYEQVWAQPMLQLAKQYRVSSNAVAKACRKASIPVPPRGYWAKLQHGQARHEAPAAAVRAQREVRDGYDPTDDPAGRNRSRGRCAGTH